MPEKGRPSLSNFHRFAVRIVPLNQTFNIQEILPTMRGEELMRVVLDLTGDREDLSVAVRQKQRPLICYPRSAASGHGASPLVPIPLQ